MHKNERQLLQMPLVQSPRPSNMSVVGEFDPYKNPPSIQQAKDHSRAKRIGRIPSVTYGLRICPCCQNIINNQQFDLDFQVEQLIELGIGYPLFFEIYKYFIYLILAMILVSGGSFYYLITKDCVENCYNFLGFAIINLDISAQETVKRTTIVYAITSFVLFFSCIYMKKVINKRIFELEQTTINPSQYSILLQNLPQNTTKQEISQWCGQVFKQQPLQVHIIYDSQQLLQSLQTKNALVIEYNRQQIIDRQLQQRLQKSRVDRYVRESHYALVTQKQQILQKIEQQNRILQKYHIHYRSQVLQLSSSATSSEYDTQQEQQKQQQYQQQSSSFSCYPWTGSCIITFNNSQTVDDILENYQHSTLGYIWRCVSSLFTSDKLTFFGGNNNDNNNNNNLKNNNKRIVLTKAPQPRQLLWKNMQFSFTRDLTIEILFILVMIGMMALAFKIQFAFVDYAFQQYSLNHSSSIAVLYQAIVMSLLIVCLNYLLRLVVKYLAYINKPHSYTQEQSRFCDYYTFLYIINACLTIYVVHGAAIKGNNQLLLYDIHLVMLTTAISAPLYKMLNPKRILRSLWRYYVSQIKPQTNPYTQLYLNSIFQKQQPSMADNYQYIYRMLFINVWFASIAPLGMLISLVIMIGDYWLTKYLLLAMNSQSKILSLEITKPLAFLELLPLIYVAGIIPFILKISTALSLQTFMSQFYTYGIVLIILLILVIIYLVAFHQQHKFIPPMTYCQLQLGFLHNYETENPLTRIQGEVHYLQKLFNSGKLKQNQLQIVKQAIQVKKSTTDLMSHKIVGLNRIKHKIQRRIINEVNHMLKLQYGMDLQIQNSNQPFFKINNNGNQQYNNHQHQRIEMNDEQVMADTIKQTQLAAIHKRLPKTKHFTYSISADHISKRAFGLLNSKNGGRE